MTLPSGDGAASIGWRLPSVWATTLTDRAGASSAVMAGLSSPPQEARPITITIAIPVAIPMTAHRRVIRIIRPPPVPVAFCPSVSFRGEPEGARGVG